MEDTDLIALTADIVAAHLSHNKVTTAELPGLIGAVHAALAKASAPAAPETVRAEPAVSIRSSIRPDHLVCLEDGKKLKMLKRYLRTTYDMSPDEYRAKWGLPRDYPMVAPAYAETRRDLAHAIGLGRKRAETAGAPIAADDAADVAPVAKPRGRPTKAKPAVAATKPRGIKAAKAAAQAHLGTRPEAGPDDGADNAGGAGSDL